MEIKMTPQGLLIYLTIAGYLLAFIFTLLKYRKSGHVLYILGFIAAICSFAYRWQHVGHVPMQNLFEVFLSLAILIYPISLFSDKVLHIKGYTVDMLIGVIVLFPAGFIFNAQPQQLPPALQSWLFAPHVAVYMLAYIFMAKAAFCAAAQLAEKNSDPAESATYQMACAGFPLLTLGLILGSYWGQCAWGDFWGWDPKELWSLACWLTYIGYFHFRRIYGKKYPHLSSLWVIAGFIFILITLLWVNLAKIFQGIHNYAT
jgi:ABC-type transport system involved in cytochrome c biogenesis permease subunit